MCIHRDWLTLGSSRQLEEFRCGCSVVGEGTRGLFTPRHPSTATNSSALVFLLDVTDVWGRCPPTIITRTSRNRRKSLVEICLAGLLMVCSDY